MSYLERIYLINLINEKRDATQEAIAEMRAKNKQS
jgi:hypothetical protein